MDAEACASVAFYRLRTARREARGVPEPGASTHTLSVMHWTGRRMLQAMCVVLARSSPLHLLLSWCYRVGWGGGRRHCTSPSVLLCLRVELWLSPQ